MELVYIVIAILIATFYFIISSSISSMNSDWLSHPTMEKYVTDNPECKTSQGLKCAKCGAKSIKNWGVHGANDSRRLFICNHCGTKLYRSS